MGMGSEEQHGAQALASTLLDPKTCWWPSSPWTRGGCRVAGNLGQPPTASRGRIHGQELLLPLHVLTSSLCNLF